jgi:hypothetical protein
VLAMICGLCGAAILATWHSLFGDGVNDLTFWVMSSRCARRRWACGRLPLGLWKHRIDRGVDRGTHRG